MDTHFSKEMENTTVSWKYRDNEKLSVMTGTGSLYQRIGPYVYVMITCAHNLVRFLENEDDETYIDMFDSGFFFL